jgi:hypothetical protein
VGRLRRPPGRGIEDADDRVTGGTLPSDRYSRLVERSSEPVSRTLVLVDVAIKTATVALLAWAVLDPDLPQFTGKAFTGRAVAYPVALLALPFGWWLFGRWRMAYPVAADILFGLPFLIDVAGNALDLYDTIEWWDDANHLVNWALHSAAVALLLRAGTWGYWTRVALAFGWAATSAVLWEFAEYVTFVPDSPEAATAYADTLLDLALGMVGGIAAAVLVNRLEPTSGRNQGAATPQAGGHG